jgi:carboxypeptidase Q
MKMIVFAAAASLFLSAQGADVQIRREGGDRSQAWGLLQTITDRFGARLTGSPAHEAAAAWAAQKLQSWGLSNIRREPWTFGHLGWSNELTEVTLVAPTRESLVAKPVAWTPSTHGRVQGQVVHLVPPQGDRRAVQAWMQGLAGTLKNRIVLVGAVAGTEAAGAAESGPVPGILKSRELEEMLGPWLASEGVLARIFDGAGPHGRMREYHNPTFEAPRVVPGVILRNEECGRMARLIKGGETVQLDMKLRNHWFPAGRTSQNVLAELPGTDRAAEVVMIGAHLDSWHMATGAVDNGANVATMLEAMRILSSLGLHPRRTIRIGLWSGEEEGLLGSDAYVKAHLGDFEHPQPGFQALVCYVNMDSGAGPIQNVLVFGPQAAVTYLEKLVAPFEDLGVKGVDRFLSRAYGSTDSSCFSHAGVATIDLTQGGAEFGAAYHSNFDTLESVHKKDLVGNAVIVAGVVWALANSPDPLPRFGAADMLPAVAAPR